MQSDVVRYTDSAARSQIAEACARQMRLWLLRGERGILQHIQRGLPLPAKVHVTGLPIAIKGLLGVGKFHGA